MVTALYADDQQSFFDAPGYAPVGNLGGEMHILTEKDFIPLPAGSELMFLPGRAALMAQKKRVEYLAGSLLAVAVMLPVGYTRTYLPAYRRQAGAPVLPLYGYTAVAWNRGKVVVAAVKTADNRKWEPAKYNTKELGRRITKVQAILGENRLVRHLAHCSQVWHCCTAQNLFYHRWECGIPVSPGCNANCLGCISLQASECCPSPQERISFVPTCDEIVQVGVYHLTDAPEGIVSFGQGCEGEPSLQDELIAKAIGKIRQKTETGQINMNSNGGYTEGICRIAAAGLDSLRVSMISAREESHAAYYRADYKVDAVKKSICYAMDKGVQVSLNLLSFPGFNDRPEEIEAWLDFLTETGVNHLQLRNLNYDPEAFLEAMPSAQGKPLGVTAFLNELRRQLPKVQLGSFTEYDGQKNKNSDL